MDASKFELALLAALKFGNQNIRLEILQGVVEALWDLAGINAAIIEAALEISWAKNTDLVAVEVAVKDNNNSQTGMVRVSIGGLDNKETPEISDKKPLIAITDKVVDIVPLGKTRETAHEDFVFDGRENGYTLINLLNFDENGNIGISLNQVFAELHLDINLAAANNVDSWPLGQWIGLFLGGADADVKGFLEQLLLAFDIDYSVQQILGLRIAAMIRFNPENIGDLNYILTHSDIALEIYDGAYDDVKLDPEARMLAVTLVCDDANAPTATATSTLYIDANLAFAEDVHLSLGNFSLGALISGGAEGASEAQAAAEEDNAEAADDAEYSRAAVSNSNTYGLKLVS
jgi:hypothetical protein